MSGTLVRTDNRPPNFGRIVEAFVARDYRTAADAAGGFVHRIGPLQGVQIGLISMQRIGAAEEAQRLAQIVIRRVRSADMWSADLVALTIGKCGIDEVLDAQMSAVEFCQACFYAGAACATNGRAAEATRQFDSCLQGGAACLELYLASVERADL